MTVTRKTIIDQNDKRNHHDLAICMKDSKKNPHTSEELYIQPSI